MTHPFHQSQIHFSFENTADLIILLIHINRRKQNHDILKASGNKELKSALGTGGVCMTSDPRSREEHNITEYNLEKIPRKLKTCTTRAHNKLINKREAEQP